MQQDETIFDGNLLVELTADIVTAYVRNNAVPGAELPSLIVNVLTALSNQVKSTESEIDIEKPKPAVTVRKSIQHDAVICLECGDAFRAIRRHLNAKHSLTPAAYREKWKLPNAYPMVAKGYADARSHLAKQMGLGQRKQK